MNIANFQAAVSKSMGFAKPNRYGVSITLTNLAKQKMFELFKIKAHDAKRFELFCDFAEIPSRFLVTDEARIYGQPYKVPYHQVQPEIMFQFYVGRDMKERKFFDAWIHEINDPKTNNFKYFDEFVTTVYIRQYDDLGLLATGNIPALRKGVQVVQDAIQKAAPFIEWVPGKIGDIFSGIFSEVADLGGLPPTYECALVNAYPIAIQAMPLAFGMTDQYHRIQVFMTYEYAIQKEIGTRTVVSSSVISNLEGIEG